MGGKENNKHYKSILMKVEKEALRKAKCELNERKRRIVKMAKTDIEAKKEATRRNQLKELQEDKVYTHRVQFPIEGRNGIEGSINYLFCFFFWFLLHCCRWQENY